MNKLLLGALAVAMLAVTGYYGYNYVHHNDSTTCPLQSMMSGSCCSQSSAPVSGCSHCGTEGSCPTACLSCDKDKTAEAPEPKCCKDKGAAAAQAVDAPAKP